MLPILGGMGLRLSVRRRLWVLIAGTIVGLATIYTIVACREVRESQVSEATAHLATATRIMAEALTTGASTARAQSENVAARAEVAALLTRRDRRDVAATRAAIAQTVPATASLIAVSIWDDKGSRVASTSDTLSPLPREVRRLLMDEARRAHGAAIGPVTVEGGEFQIAGVAPVTVGGVARGFAVVRRRVSTGTQSKTLTELIGSGALILLGNRDGDPWTDLVAPVAAPPATVRRSAGITQYSDAKAGQVLASVAPIPKTPWAVIVAFPMREVLTQPHDVLTFLLLVDALVAVIAIVGAWQVSRIATRPLDRLTVAANAISHGNYSTRIDMIGNDEFGAVAGAFNRMAEHINYVRDDLRKRAEVFEASDARHRALFEASPHPAWVYDLETLDFLAVNDAAVDAYGYSREEFLGMSVLDIRPPEDVPAVLGELRRPAQAPGQRPGVWRHRRKNGSLFEVEVGARELEYAGRRAQLVIATDVTARGRAERTLVATQERMQHLLRSSGAVIVDLSAHGDSVQLEWISENVAQILGYAPDEAFANRWWTDAVHPEDRTQLRGRPHVSAYRDGALEYRFKHKDGRYRWLREQMRVFRDEQGQPVEVVVAWIDVTDRRMAEGTLRATQERLRQIVNASGAVLYNLRVTGSNITAEWVSDNLDRIFGYTLEDVQAPGWWVSNVEPDDLAEILRRAPNSLESGAREYRFRRKDGTYRWIRDEQHLLRDVNGNVIEVVGTWLDTTDRRALEGQLFQAQKMEAVGRLAGGVAHDFNNLLTVILAETTMALENGVPEPIGEQIEEIKRAAERAALLTRQLLTFSRRQLLEPVTLNPNDVVAKVDKMLRRLIGEDVALETALEPDLGSIVVDRGQLQQVLMNLAVNARDAMPNGGTLTVMTSNATLSQPYAGLAPGAYVLIGVTDTGFGMTEEVKSHLFEPFFTTKERGKGTGLGLATCYAIVKQFHGHIDVVSETGRGTTFRIYFPRVVAVVEPAVPDSAQRSASGRETILLVEDEPQVRRVAARILGSQGYSVVEAPDAEEALRVLENAGQPLDLLLTDVVLPKMGGPELAEHARRLRPNLPVLYASGYSDDVMLQKQLLVGDAALLQKPYTLVTLPKKVREVLDAASTPHPV